MLLKLENPGLLMRAIEIISELVTEVKIKVNDYGMGITALDSANVAMISFKLPKTAFSQFNVEGEQTLGVNLINLRQVLKRCSTRSALVIETKNNLLQLQVLDRIKRNFILALIDIESEEKEIPPLEFSSKIEMNSIDFVDSIEDCAIVADACSFIIRDNNFIIEAKGLNSAMSEFSPDEIKIEAENCRAKYSLEYLQKFIKGARLSEKIILSFANDYPLKIDFKTPDVHLSFILAPRVENEE